MHYPVYPSFSICSDRHRGSYISDSSNARLTSSPIVVRWRGIEPYEASFDAMRIFTNTRTINTIDEIWIVEHPPVYTLGQAGDPAHLLVSNSTIPIVKVDRGGQITYHGPGQIVIYLLLDLRRRKLMVRRLVSQIETTVIHILSTYNLSPVRKIKAPGVYVKYDDSKEYAKISALGLRIRNGCSYHGFSLNVKMDLRPFYAINPCGYVGLETIDMASIGIDANLNDVAHALVLHLISNLNNESNYVALPLNV
ncbi:MAG: lipoyl(octanoyl) transferase LipB [Burkholderia sp.]|nr:lipoyl(octanoyl) transferase LipB [Burkholderia sp.]